MKKASSMLLISVLALLVFLIAPDQTVRAADEMITLGYSGPLSGGAAKFGFNIQWGMELAADEINALGGATVGGKKYKVRVVSMDDRFQAALAPNPELLLLDEPAGGVNLEEVGVLIDLITRIRDSGVTICLIEHKMSMVMNISDRILALNYGKKVTEGTPAEVCRNEQVIKSYLGDKYAAARRSG